eukprot:SM000089S23832  [mRNA]  locus=s89:224414:226533:- [translate_table: standard]
MEVDVTTTAAKPAAAPAGPRRDGAIPSAPFVDDVAAFVGGRDSDAVLQSLDERLQQYKLAEAKLLAQQRDFEGKIPEIRKCMEAVTTLQTQHIASKETTLDFEVGEGIFARAAVPPGGAVCLWLGANVMLEYPHKEATELLQRNLDNATAGLASLALDATFLRDQATTTEVTISRVYNWEVQQRRLRRTAAATVEATAGEGPQARSS